MTNAPTLRQSIQPAGFCAALAGYVEATRDEDRSPVASHGVVGFEVAAGAQEVAVLWRRRRSDQGRSPQTRPRRLELRRLLSVDPAQGMTAQPSRS